MIKVSIGNMGEIGLFCLTESDWSDIKLEKVINKNLDL